MVISFILRDELPLPKRVFVMLSLIEKSVMILQDQVCKLISIQVLAMFANYQQEFSIFDNYQLNIEPMASRTISYHDVFDTIRLDRGYSSIRSL
jgi:hypothetical protein